MLVIIARVLTIFYIISIQGVCNSSSTSEIIEMLSIGRNQTTENSSKYDSDVIMVLLQRMEQIDKNINLRLDRVDVHLLGLEVDVQKIMKQQMVCCGVYQNSAPISESTTPQTTTTETTTSETTTTTPQTTTTETTTTETTTPETTTTETTTTETTTTETTTPETTTTETTTPETTTTETTTTETTTTETTTPETTTTETTTTETTTTETTTPETTTTQPTTPKTTTPTPTTTVAPLPTNCEDAMGTSGENGIYKINVPNSGMDPFDVYCINKTVNKPLNGIWMIFQRRQYNDITFYRGWAEYKRGFGSLDKDFWIGLDKLHALTNFTEQELWIQLENENVWSLYSEFAVGTEKESYALNTLGTCIGPAGDSLRYHIKGKWSTFDKNNDKRDCVNKRKGAWWYKNCGNSNLNGMYGVHDPLGVVWHTWKPYHSNKYAHMAIRPKP